MFLVDKCLWYWHIAPIPKFHICFKIAASFPRRIVLFITHDIPSVLNSLSTDSLDALERDLSSILGDKPTPWDWTTLVNDEGYSFESQADKRVLTHEVAIPDHPVADANFTPIRSQWRFRRWMSRVFVKFDRLVEQKAQDEIIQIIRVHLFHS